MTDTIFISHSCKDHETGPPDGLDAAAQAARRERLEFARLLRDEIHAALQQSDRFEPFLDVRGGLQAGDVWRDGLHHALRRCSGGIVLLTPESLESGWVLKEATILSWRVFLRERVMLVPVVCGVSGEELDALGFGALDLDQIQRVTVRDASAAEREKAVRQVVEAMERLPEPGPGRWTSPADRWVDEFADQLALGIDPQRSEPYVHAMSQALGIEAEDPDRYERNPFGALAIQTLTAAPEQIVSLLYKAKSRGKPQREELANYTRPMWVDSVPASRLVWAAERRGFVAINVEDAQVACDYVRRAFCTNIQSDHILVPEPGADVIDDDTALAQVEELVRHYFPVDEPEAMRKEVRANGPIFVVLGRGLLRAGLLDALRRKHPSLTLIAVTGEHVGRALGPLASQAVVLRPALTENALKQGIRYKHRLKAFETGVS